MDALGYREELRDMARRIAAQGYVCVLPDMFYRLGSIRLDLRRGLEQALPIARAAMAHLTYEMVMRDLAGLFALLKELPYVDATQAGCIGHCMSGRHVLNAMAQFPAQMKAGMALYGTGMVTDRADSPHLRIDDIAGTIYLAFGETDPFVSEDVRHVLETSLKAHGVRHRTDVLQGAGHGFAFPQRSAYNQAAAELTWTRMFELFRSSFIQ